MLEVVATSSADRSATNAVPSRQRSRITNGRLLPGDNRGPWARRCRDLISEHLSDLGGLDNTSAAEQSLVRRAAVMTIELEALEQKFATVGAASATDLDLYIRASGNLRRLLEAVGLSRRARDVGELTLGDLMRADIEERRLEAAAKASTASKAAAQSAESGDAAGGVVADAEAQCTSDAPAGSAGDAAEDRPWRVAGGMLQGCVSGEPLGTDTTAGGDEDSA